VEEAEKTLEKMKTEGEVNEKENEENICLGDLRNFRERKNYCKK
jgi:hypothetical protein